MATLVTMPKLSDTMEEGAVASWLKKQGEKVEEGEPLAEIETDKATMEYESPEEGYILKLVIGDGGKAPVGAAIAVFGETKDETYDLDALIAAEGGGQLAVPPAPAPAETATPAQTATPVAAETPRTELHVVANVGSGARVKASPLAKKKANDLGLDLTSITGSGPGGRIVVSDLESAPAPKAVPSSPSPSLVASSEDQLVRVTMMRGTIAKRLLAGKNDAPHFYLTRSANMERTMTWRKRMNKEAEASGAVKVSVNDLIMLACAKALRKHPLVNASWEGENIRMFGSVHVAMAVALPEGLVTPVVRNTDRLGVRDIAAQTKALAKKARDGELVNDDFTGGTFTVSNLGMMGIEEFTAIINPPQAAILAVGATRKVPVIAEDGQVVAEDRMTMVMSCDHRVVDGMVGAEFLKTLVSYLEDPMMMLS